MGFSSALGAAPSQAPRLGPRRQQIQGQGWRCSRKCCQAASLQSVLCGPVVQRPANFPTCAPLLVWHTPARLLMAALLEVQCMQSHKCCLCLSCSTPGKTFSLAGHDAGECSLTELLKTLLKVLRMRRMPFAGIRQPAGASTAPGTSG